MKVGQIYLVNRVNDKRELYNKLWKIVELDESLEDPRGVAETINTKDHNERSTETTTRAEFVKSWLEEYGKVLAEDSSKFEDLKKEYCNEV